MYKGFTRVLDIFLIYKGFGKFGGSKLGVIVMFPTKGISKVQRQQMVSCTAHNVKVAMLLLVMLPCCHVGHVAPSHAERQDVSSLISSGGCC